jgi:broad specificity phosphatase PhoE
MFIHLVRHGRTSVVEGDYYGSCLSPEGAQQARDLAASGKLQKPDLLLSSPFPRALETASILGAPFGLRPVIDPNFAEWHLQTLNLEDIEYEREESAGWADFDAVVAGGESLSQLRVRALVGLDKIAAGGATNVLIVSHGTILDVVCAYLARRDAFRTDIRTMEYLAHALVEAKSGKLELKRDILALEGGKTK